MLKENIFTDLKFTHQTPSFHTHIVGAGIEAGRPVSGALGLTDVESIAGGSAGQLALLIGTNCNKGAGIKNQTLFMIFLQVRLSLQRVCGRPSGVTMNAFPCGQETEV